jgi:4-amino-4-deoxy-L-arabinose transferase-like glycosyltransferase
MTSASAEKSPEKSAENNQVGQLQSVKIFLLIFSAVTLLHLPLVRLPYFWDEAGYYVPAARDLLLTGSLIPHSTPSNAHPPLVMAYLALCWKAAGYSPLVTRIAMLAVAAFSLLGLFRLAERVANTEVAFASVLCTAIYPVFFVQSSLAQVDLAVAGFTFWALLAYVQKKRWQAALWFALAALAKETAILAPIGLVAWELYRSRRASFRQRSANSALLMIPAVPLALWFAYHRAKTGFVFGNPEFFRYNVQATSHPLRILLAFLMRVWQSVGYMNLYLLTISMLGAMWLPPLKNGESSFDERPRIDPEVQFVFAAIPTIYILAFAVIGGAVLARYMLSVVPLVILIGVSTLWRRVPAWKWIIAVVVLGFGAGLFVNPPYGFTLEDNLAYCDYILLHQEAETFVQARYPSAQVLTAWPASGELSQPWLGYVTRPMRVLQIENFTAEELMSAAEQRPNFDVALVFSTKYEPPHPLMARWPAWEKIKERFFGYHRDLPPLAAAQVLGGRLVYSHSRNGQWVGVIEMERIEEARR